MKAVAAEVEYAPVVPTPWSPPPRKRVRKPVPRAATALSRPEPELITPGGSPEGTYTREAIEDEVMQRAEEVVREAAVPVLRELLVVPEVPVDDQLSQEERLAQETIDRARGIVARYARDDADHQYLLEVLGLAG